MALAVALSIYFRSGIEQSKRAVLFPSALKRFHVNRWSAYRALTALENAGLVTVTRQSGRSPLVTILDFEGPEVDDPLPDALKEPSPMTGHDNATPTVSVPK
jgi:hypothetical protein